MFMRCFTEPPPTIWRYVLTRIITPSVGACRAGKRTPAATVSPTKVRSGTASPAPSGRHSRGRFVASSPSTNHTDYEPPNFQYF